MMKNITLAALFAASAVYAGPFETWNGADGNSQVQTGLGNETETNGYWYTYEDYASFSCVTDAIDPPFITCTDVTIDICKGFCGTARLHQGTSATKAFIGVGFNIVGETSTTNNTPAAGDASSWGGLCVTYTSDVDLQLELGLGDIVDSTISYANPAVTLPAAKSADILSPNGTNGNKVVVSWSDFKQPSWYDGAVKIDGETAVKQLVAIHFKLQADPGNYDFNICAVGPKDGTCPEKCGIPSSEQRIKVARGVTTIKTILNERTLRFTGIESATTVEVINSLGQVVMNSVIDKTDAKLNLAPFDAGIYMIRVEGNNVNFAKKIVLK